MEKLELIKKIAKREVEKCNDVIAEFAKEAAINPEYTIKWKANDVVIAQSKLRFLSILSTAEDLSEARFLIEDTEEYVMREIMGNYNRHNSTCQWSNSVSAAKHEANLEIISFIKSLK